jgi:hypothetical protein
MIVMESIRRSSNRLLQQPWINLRVDFSCGRHFHRRDQTFVEAWIVPLDQ